MRTTRTRYMLIHAVVAGLVAAACGGSTAAESGSPGGNSGAGGSAGVVGSAGSGGAGGNGGAARVPAKHRANATACDDIRPMTDPNAPDAAGPPVNCRSHADCTMGANGRCVSGRDGWNCTYDECFTDGDCAATGGVCACEGGSRADNNVCLRGNCRTDADCGDNGYCSPTLGPCGNYTGVTSYYCHTPQDECVDDADCGGAAAYCAYSVEAGRWKCANAHCVG